MFSSPVFVFVAGLVQAAVVAVAAFLSAPGDLTGYPLVVAVVGVALSAVATYLSTHKLARELRGRKLRSARRIGEPGAHRGH